MTYRDVIDIALVIVAVVGGIVGVLSYRASRKDKYPSLKASVHNGLFIYNRYDLGETKLFLSLANPGEKAVKITYATITIKGRKILFPNGLAGEKQIPFVLPPGESVDFWISLDSLKSALRIGGFFGNQKIKAYFKDAVENEYISKPFLVEVGKK